MKNLLKLRLKDLSNLTKKEVDYAVIMKEVCGYNNPWIARKWVFKKKFQEAHELITYVRQLDISKIEWSDDCKIARPKDIDHITFRAMMELQMLAFGETQTDDIVEIMTQMITVACYSENHPDDYLSNSTSFIEFKNTVSNSCLIHMVGLYNWIHDSLKQSQLMWEKRFLSVEVKDEDYEQVNGPQKMSQFNVNSTIKTLCRDYNCSKDEAWQMSYIISQVNSYEYATRNYIQDEMRKIKELKMREERRLNTPQ